MSWREEAAPIIAQCIREHAGDEKALKKALRDAYPFGQRKYHPYKVWLDEIRKQMGTRKKNNGVNPNQMSLF